MSLNFTYNPCEHWFDIECYIHKFNLSCADARALWDKKQEIHLYVVLLILLTSFLVVYCNNLYDISLRNGTSEVYYFIENGRYRIAKVCDCFGKCKYHQIAIRYRKLKF